MIATRSHTAVIVRGRQTYMLLWTSETWREAIRQTGRWAGNRGLNFHWYDAANVARIIRMEAETDLSRRKTDARIEPQIAAGNQAG